MSCCFVVIVPQDANPFTVERQQMVRLARGRHLGIEDRGRG